MEGGRRGGGGWRVSFIKTIEQEDSESFQVGEHIKVLERWYPQRGQGSPTPLPHTWPMIFSIWLFMSCVLYDKPGNISNLFDSR